MFLSGDRTFVGFGFGAIQAGLFLYEAFRSGAFRRLVVAEVQPELVSAVRQAGGDFSVNIAYRDRIEAQEVGPVEIFCPEDPRDRELMVQAVAGAGEIATALPSVRHYTSDSAGSVHRILAEGLRRKAAASGPPAVVYAAENHNQAAEILKAAVLSAVPREEHETLCSRVRFLNTVIGKMSGVVVDPDEMLARGLAPVTPHGRRAFLVEAFNRIFISGISFENSHSGPAFRRGIAVFEEKPDLLPFEEAKLYGHNSTHALAAYVGAVRGVKRIMDLAEVPGVARFLEAAFIEESGEALVRRHHGLDMLFTPAGYRAYAADLLERMFNPYLGDTVERVGRDAARKLEWGDRLVGTVRIGLQYAVRMPRFSLGAAAAAAALDPAVLHADFHLPTLLDPLWRRASPGFLEKQAVLGALEQGRNCLRQWRERGFPDLESFVQEKQSEFVHFI